MWNSKYSKLSLSIRDKTQHQRRHLNSIVSIKSRVDSRQPWKKSPSTSKTSNTHRQSLSPFERDKMQHENYLLASRIMEIGKRQMKKQQLINRFTLMSRSLSQVVVNTRSRALKSIDKQNIDLYKRLVGTKPMYKTDHFRKFASDSDKYKSNILRTKMHNIDYTKLAQKKPFVNKFKLISISSGAATT